MIYVKFDQDNKSCEMTYTKTEVDGYVELDDSFMGKRLIKVKGKVREFTEDEIQKEFDDFVKKNAEIVNRLKRDNLLKEADNLTQMDVWEKYTQKQKDEVSEYKQALRDLPLQKGFPIDVTFPELPKW